MKVDHPNASELLERDISNVLRFFKRRYKMDTSLESAVERVTGLVPREA